MRHFLLLIGISSLLSVESFSNPIFDPYSAAGISEVYIASPYGWYVELDGTWCLYGSKNTVFPCSVDVYLQIRSSTSLNRGFCRARVEFAANKIGVIRHPSLRPTVLQMDRFKLLPLSSTDTVIVAMDTSQKAANGLPYQYWSFPLRPVPEGNSLITVHGNQKAIYSTSRRSIGSHNNYRTRYNIAVRDRYKNPLGSLGGGFTGDASFTTGDSVGMYYVSVPISTPRTVFHLDDPQTPHLPGSFTVATLELSYNDNDTLINKILEIPVTQYLLTLKGTDLSGLRAYKEYQGGYLPIDYVDIDHSVLRLFRVYKSEPACRICFSPGTKMVESTGYWFGPPVADSQCLGTWMGKYIDTPAIIKKTIPIAPNHIVNTRRSEIPAVKSGLTLSGLCENNREVRLIVSSALPIAKGSLSLFAINGKQIKSQPLAMNGAGTTTVLFRFPGGQLSPGRYLCQLTIAGSKAAACPVTVP